MLELLGLEPKTSPIQDTIARLGSCKRCALPLSYNPLVEVVVVVENEKMIHNCVCVGGWGGKVRNFVQG